jgi:hypothetical protein
MEAGADRSEHEVYPDHHRHDWCERTQEEEYDRQLAKRARSYEEWIVVAYRD